MDIELARTFLEVMSAGSFIEAAQRLHVSQTTVTARIRSLETALGCQLFVRNRAGARLTADGERFVRYATDLVQTWNHARAELRLPQGQQSRLRIGGETSLWNPVLVNWLLGLHRQHPELAVHTEVDDAAALLSQLERGSLDAAIVHRPNYHSAFVVAPLLEERLIHVESAAGSGPALFIDWGPQFRNQYDAALPQPRQAALSFNLGPLALRVLLQLGGNGYFRTRVVQPYLDRGELRRVTGSPEFSYPIYLVYRAGDLPRETRRAIKVLQRVAADDPQWSL